MGIFHDLPTAVRRLLEMGNNLGTTLPPTYSVKVLKVCAALSEVRIEWLRAMEQEARRVEMCNLGGVDHCRCQPGRGSMRQGQTPRQRIKYI
jgi:hypothetical protein